MSNDDNVLKVVASRGKTTSYSDVVEVVAEGVGAAAAVIVEGDGEERRRGQVGGGRGRAPPPKVPPPERHRPQVHAGTRQVRHHDDVTALPAATPEAGIPGLEVPID